MSNTDPTPTEIASAFGRPLDEVRQRALLQAESRLCDALRTLSEGHRYEALDLATRALWLLRNGAGIHVTTCSVCRSRHGREVLHAAE